MKIRRFASGSDVVADVDPRDVFHQQAEVVAGHPDQVLMVPRLEKHLLLVTETRIEDRVDAIGLAHNRDGALLAVAESERDFIVLDYFETARHDLVESIQIQPVGRGDDRKQIIDIVTEQNRLGHLFRGDVGYFNGLLQRFGVWVFDDLVGHPVTLEIVLDGRCDAHECCLLVNVFWLM